MSNTPDQGGVDQPLTATATNLVTGETIADAGLGRQARMTASPAAKRR
jgi:hypothetical protein